MNIRWDPDAKASFRQIARYINTRFGRSARQRFLQKVKDTERLIKHSPNIGPIDSLFSSRPATYHSVVINGLSKMVYRIDDDIIHIVGFWDTRQEPEAQAKQVR